MSELLMERARSHAARTAIVDDAGEHGYDRLLDASGAVARALLAGRADLAEERVAFMVSPGFGYVAAQWGVWRAGGVAVPLCLSHPDPELDYVLEDTGATTVVAGPEFAARLAPLARARGARLLPLEDALREESGAALPRVDAGRRAMVLYTSGTTSRPKGVVSTHANLRAQIESLVEAWGWSADDRILHVLPLHHVHGIVNVLLCALWTGAVCEMHPGFDAARVWARLGEGAAPGAPVGGGVPGGASNPAAGEPPSLRPDLLLPASPPPPLTLFMAVPTIYVKLIAAWEAAAPEQRERWSRGCRALRLMVSGSAALPVSTLERWREISGHTLLERYGMTEIGMALSNPLRGERRPGHVGQPLPGVGVRLVDESGAEIGEEGRPGEIEVRGPTVFLEYWRRPEATRDAFRDGWFRTGDVAVLERGYYRILGRSSVDIIKTGGYKVSALEIEEAVRAHPGVRDCAVVGVEDPEWGERVCAAIVPSDGGEAPEALREWLSTRLAPYKVPRRWVVVEELPRNAMGKVTKPAVKELFSQDPLAPVTGNPA